ncbi:hypothetical protein [Methanosarcina siciliae]|uniref:hypothetical protein n=1 Tax=Methanosarcina siciliae TaxID=38027 RepID=UPI00064F1FFB|nr:hypothetical protein [Methanosarcina siciliae]
MECELHCTCEEEFRLFRSLNPGKVVYFEVEDIICKGKTGFREEEKGKSLMTTESSEDSVTYC